MNTTTRMALIELKEWCQRYHAVIERSPYQDGMIRIIFGRDLEDTDFVHFGQFDQSRTTIITEQRENI